MINNIRKTVNKKSIRDIWKLNIFFAGTAFVSILLLLFLFSEMISAIILIALKTSCYILITSFFLVIILKFAAKKHADNLYKFRLVRFSLSYIVGIIIYLALWPLFAYWANLPPRLNSMRLLLAFVFVAIIITSIILFLHDFIIFRNNKNQTELENSRLQARSAEAQNLILRQQIHPHFLFNALNTLKALYKKDNALGETYLIQLADFLRATISNNGKAATTLAEELLICRNYLEMQKMRFAEALEWKIDITDTNLLSGLVPSFALQPLLENAIKHNILEKQKPLKIMITNEGDEIKVSNNINAKEYSEESIRSGLGNLAERYHLLSGNDIRIDNNGITFSVSFKIISNEGNNN